MNRRFPKEIVDLVISMLAFDPAKRISAKEALKNIVFDNKFVPYPQDTAKETNDGKL